MRFTDIISMAKDYLALGIVAVLLLAIVFFIGYFLVYKKVMKGKKQISFQKLALASILFCYIVIVLGATLGSRGGYGRSSALLIPFSSYREAWNNFSVKLWRNIILNILMFVPFGLFLPLVSPKFRKGWKAYLAGLVFTLAIECIQYFSGRGIFEIDDIIGNTTGTIIGYGLFMLLFYFIERSGEKIVIVSGKKAAAYQIPLMIAILLFSGIFLTYSKQELGNLSIAYNYKHYMSDILIESDISFSSETGRAPVYKAVVGTKEDTQLIANDILDNIGTYVDENQNDYYEESAIYKSACGNYTVWVDYTGLTVWFINHNVDSDVNAMYTLEEVIPILEQYNITLPEEVDFYDEGEGKYRITADMSEFENGYIDGSLSCTITSEGILSNFRNNMIQYKKYKEYDIISEQQAFENLRNGKVHYWYLHDNPNSIVIKNVVLDYHLDSKGFYQPVYVFEVLLNGDSRTEIPMPALVNVN